MLRVRADTRPDYRQFKMFFTPIKMAIAPVVLTIAVFDAVSFGFFVAMNALTPVWLQLPKKAGGVWGFSITDNAACRCLPGIGFLGRGL